jgi:hypothetical protein
MSNELGERIRYQEGRSGKSPFWSYKPWYGAGLMTVVAQEDHFGTLEEATNVCGFAVIWNFSKFHQFFAFILFLMLVILDFCLHRNFSMTQAEW